MEQEDFYRELYDSCDDVMQFALETMGEIGLEERYSFATPEFLMFVMLYEKNFECAVKSVCSDKTSFTKDLAVYLAEQEVLPQEAEAQCVYSHQLMQLLQVATAYRLAAESPKLRASHVVAAMYELEDSMLAYLLHQYIPDKASFLLALIEMEESGSSDSSNDSSSQVLSQNSNLIEIDDILDELPPFVGREAEMEQMVQSLCRKDKHHLLLVGEMGVGKRTMVYELANRMRHGLLPDQFEDASVFMLNLKTLLVGLHFRGDLERRMADVLQSVSNLKKVVIFIPDIQLLHSSFSKSEEVDVISLLSPYIDSDSYRFIGITTPQGYTRSFSGQQRFENVFQKIDVEEPSEEDALRIIQLAIHSYEEYHKVEYDLEAMKYAVSVTAKHLHGSFLPQKALTLLDDAGAYIVSHNQETKRVDVSLLSKLMAKTCKNDTLLIDADGDVVLATLEERILSKIYGQDDAVRLIVENVQMGKAGLLDDHKPLASFLFVGPTGVGKTELANVLAQEMGVSLVRFDMSEYVEQYTVSKLIGSPAGYVGYDEGGLLTEAVRKQPNCVLLLDEIEKAHTDIYNILLQVMDYARLTDNKGNHADFRNVVLIMTSNAGAQFASQSVVGFGSTVKSGAVMAKQVKRTFKPEFLNRLTASVVFNDMDIKMAELVLDKKLRLLQEKLQARKVDMRLSDEVRSYLLQMGYSREYGAREMDRIVAQQLKPLLTKEILFGRLKNGGAVEVVLENDKLVLSCCMS